MDEAEKLRNGNTRLIEALMDMVNQFFYSDKNDDGLLSHSYMSAEEMAIDTLIDAGFAVDTGKGYRLLWDKLEERKAEIKLTYEKKMQLEKATRNQLANIKNPYQTKALRILCVCSAGLLRSPTMANVIYNEYGYNTRAAGCDEEFALIPVTEALVEWADHIICASYTHYEKLSKLGVDTNKLHHLSISDIYDWDEMTLRKEISDQMEKLEL